MGWCSIDILDGKCFGGFGLKFQWNYIGAIKDQYLDRWLCDIKMAYKS
jgi:hypothetical protein